MSLTEMMTKFNIGIKKNFNTDAFKRDIDEIDWSLAIGNTDVNLDFSKTLHIDPPVKKTSRKIQNKNSNFRSQGEKDTQCKLELSYTKNLSNQKITKHTKSNKQLLKSIKINYITDLLQISTQSH